MENTENTAPKKKSGLRWIILAAVLGIGLFFGIRYWIISSSYESTDNAQLDAAITPIRSSVQGYVRQILFEDNDTIKKGELLISIDDIDPKAKMAQAEAALQNAKANVQSLRSSAKAGRQNAEATVSSSDAVKQNIQSAQVRETKAAADFQRIESMFKGGAATKTQYDAAKAELDLSKAQFAAAQSQYKSAESQSGGAFSQAEAQVSQIALAEALVHQREAELILAKTQVGYTQVLAPCNGTVSKKSVEPGQYIQVGQPLCSAVDNDKLWVTANFKETQMKNLKIGQEVEIEVDAYPGTVLNGKVESFGGATGAKFSLLPPDNATGNFVKVTQRVPVRIAITNYPKDAHQVLVPGLSTFVKVKIK